MPFFAAAVGMGADGLGFLLELLQHGLLRRTSTVHEPTRELERVVLDSRPVLPHEHVVALRRDRDQRHIVCLFDRVIRLRIEIRVLRRELEPRCRENRLAVANHDLALGAGAWIPAYRTPAGVGLEKSAAFRAIDLRIRQTLECRCFGGERPVVRYPVEMRFRWRKGALPAASASVERGDRAETLPVALSVGRLLVYEFRLAESFPAGNAGVCGGRLVVAAVVEPPVR